MKAGDGGDLEGAEVARRGRYRHEQHDAALNEERGKERRVDTERLEHDQEGGRRDEPVRQRPEEHRHEMAEVAEDAQSVGECTQRDTAAILEARGDATREQLEQSD